MTAELYLDPEMTADLEPFEGDARNGESIAYFAVPLGLTSGMAPDGKVAWISFEYPGNPCGGEAVRLDDQLQPEIRVRDDATFGTLVSLHFDPSIDAAGIRSAAKRIGDRALSIRQKSMQFSYQMIAGVLDRFADRIASPPPM